MPGPKHALSSKSRTSTAALMASLSQSATAPTICRCSPKLTYRSLTTRNRWSVDKPCMRSIIAAWIQCSIFLVESRESHEHQSHERQDIPHRDHDQRRRVQPDAHEAT